MKTISKILIFATMLMCAVFTLVGCNVQLIDTTFKFDKAVIYLPNGKAVEGNVESWRDFSESDQLQVTLDDGKTYLTHATNVLLIAEE